jgi:hypothetical protein
MPLSSGNFFLGLSFFTALFLFYYLVQVRRPEFNLKTKNKRCFLSHSQLQFMRKVTAVATATQRKEGDKNKHPSSFIFSFGGTTADSQNGVAPPNRAMGRETRLFRQS